MTCRFLFLLLVLMLVSCAYTTDGTTQNITVETPGAQDAVCYVYADGMRFKFTPPQTSSIPKFRRDLILDCWAPGNRRKKISVEPHIAKSSKSNVVNGMVPGMAWDYASNAIFAFPEVIEVDFRDVPLMPLALPSYNNPDIRQPEDYDLEEFRPGQPALNEDRYREEIPIRPSEHARRRLLLEQGGLEAGADAQAGEVSMPGGKGDLMRVIGDLGSTIDPAAEPSPPSAADEPVPAYPGE